MYVAGSILARIRGSSGCDLVETTDEALLHRIDVLEDEASQPVWRPRFRVLHRHAYIALSGAARRMPGGVS